MNPIPVLIATLVACGVQAAVPRVENRTPKTGEIGYRPADGAVADLNPPSFAWLHESGAVLYAVECAATPDFKNAIAVSNLNFNCHTFSAPLKAGDYYWRYRFSGRDGEVSNWSTTRRFTVPAGAVEFPMPSKAERLQRVPAGHPRLFLRPEDLPRLRLAATNGPAAVRFAELRRRADRLIGRELVREPKQPGTASNKTNVTLLQNWWANRVQTLQACEEAETVSFVYLVTGEAKYGEDARRRILDLAEWDPAGETNFRRNCEAAKPLLHRLSRACDWAWDRLSPEDLARIKAVLKRRMADAWESGEVGRGVGHINRPLNSHGNRTWHKIGESGIVFLGEIPEAELWLDYAVNKFYACYPVWSDEDGGWHEGLSYWAGYMSKAVWWVHAARVALDIDGFKKPFFHHVGDFALYMAPPGTSTMGFGDLSGGKPSAGIGNFMEFFERNAGGLPENNARYWRWWTEQWKMSGANGVLGFLYAATQPELPEPKPPTDLPASKVFRGIGVASLHTTLLEAGKDVHFLFKSSPFGGMSHGHNSQNGFQLTAYGDTLLPACVYRDWYGTAFHNDWVQQTISQNALLVDGQGQVPHSGDARGEIVASELTPAWDYVLGDATPAYAGRVTRALRHIVFVKPGLIVICDEVSSPKPATFQLMLHALSEFEVDAGAQRLHVQQPHSGLTVQYLAAEPLQLKQWDGFEPKPLKTGFANHWHVQAGTSSAARETALLTVLAVHPGKQPMTLKAERVESGSAIGVRATLEGKPIRVALRKAGRRGEVEWDGVRFDRPVWVECP